jgi:hypothetical protein
MKVLCLVVIALLIPLTTALAQQDPNDPGLPDSLIIKTFQVDSGSVILSARIWVVSDDSVFFYNMPIAWHDPSGNMNPTGAIYFPPLTSWDIVFDSVVSSESYIRMLGFSDADSDVNPPLMTNYQRVNVITLRFAIAPGTLPAYPVVLDTIFDAVNGSLAFGLVDGVTEFKPIFRPDSFYIRTGTGENDPLPTEFNLAQNYPNPFNSSTTINFSIDKAENVSLTVFDLLGRRVRTLINNGIEAGSYSVIWDGKDESGRDAPSGTYFYRLSTDNAVDAKRMTLIR